MVAYIWYNIDDANRGITDHITDQWRVGESFEQSCSSYEVDEITADNAELAYILKHTEGIRRSNRNCTTMTWYGDDARFIVENVIVSASVNKKE